MSLKQKTVWGIKWSAFAQLIDQVLRFVIGVILARLLTPDEFGLIGMVTVFTGVVALFGNLGFSSAVIQKQDLTPLHYSSVFWVNVVVGLALSILVFFTSYPIAWFYDTEVLIPITMALSINFILSSLTVVQKALITKTMRFNVLAVRSIVVIGVSGAAAIIAAVTGFGVWSLVIQNVTQNLMNMILFWSYSDWRPDMKFNKEAVIELLPYSSNLFGSYFLNYWARNTDNLLIGKFLGDYSLGIYSRAYSLLRLPMKQISRVIGQVMFPSLSKIQDDKARVKEVFLKAISAIAIFTFPMMLGLFVISEDFIMVIYGAKWVDVIPLLQIFSILGLFQSISFANAWIFTSQGRTDIQFKWMIFASSTIIAAIIFGIYLGSLMWIVICYSSASLLLIYPESKIAGKIINLRAIEIILQLKNIFLVSVFMAIDLVLLNHFLLRNIPDYMRLVIDIAVGSIIYFSTLWFFREKNFLEVKSLLVNRKRL